MRSLALRSPDLAALIGNGTRRAFVRIVDLCLEEQVDALLLAGDLYDGEQTSMKTARFLAEQVRRLHGAGIRVFIIRGNHDALSKITQELTFPDTVKIFGGRADVVEIERARGEIPIAIHGVSFAKPHAPESLLAKYKPPVVEAVNLGLMHTSLEGTLEHNPYAPCSVGDLHESGFRYWALGHIHKRSLVEGACTIAMPGIPQGRDINEAGPKSVNLVTIGDDRSIRVEERFTGVAQFERVVVDLTAIDDWRDLVGSIAGAMERARSGIVSEHLVARLHLVGNTPLAWRIRRDLDLVKAEADDRASLLGGCWVEKIDVACRAPGIASSSPDDPLTGLHRLIDEDVLGSEAFREQMGAVFDDLRKQLAREGDVFSRDFELFGTGEDGLKRFMERIARDGVDDVLARLHSGTGAIDA